MTRRSGDYQELIQIHLPLIERQCFKVIRLQLKAAGYGNRGENLQVNLENEALELSNQVLDLLQRDNYRVLRQFKGEAQITTYINAIIARQAVDALRKKLGRNREKERAQKLGPPGIKIHEYLYQQGCAVPEIHTRLSQETGFSLSVNDVQEMVDKIKGHRLERGILDCDSPVKEGCTTISADKNSDYTEEEFIIPDTSNEPAHLMEESEQQTKVNHAIQDLLAHLDGEERLVLKIRFPMDEETKTGSVAKIAMLLNITEKAAYKRISRVLKKCRDFLAQQGVTSHDLV